MTALSQARRTKIVATLGPASAEEDILVQMVAAGVDVFRINSAHGSPDLWSGWIQRIRRVSADVERHVGVLLDLQGPRIRVGTLREPVMLRLGQEVTFAPEARAGGADIPTTYDGLAHDVVPGTRILLDDGLLCVEVARVDGDIVRGVVRQPGLLRSGKGMNLPGALVSAPTLTETDRANLATAVECGVDLVGVSFVRRAEDVEEVRRLVPGETGLVAKIETTSAVDDYSRLLDVADAIMVARGDLGVELPFEKVPIAQKQLIRQANHRARPTITATQMLDSMVRNPRPTRAEASDVANAILDGTDAVMLSGETAIGAYPVEAVRAMARICLEVERSARGTPAQGRRDVSDAASAPRAVADAIALATTEAAAMLRVPLIACFTKSGFTARQMAAYRPATPIVGLSPEATTCRSLAGVWGVTPILVRDAPTYEAMLGEARDVLLARGIVCTGDRIAVTAGVPFHVPGTTNLLKVETV